MANLNTSYENIAIGFLALTGDELTSQSNYALRNIAIGTRALTKNSQGSMNVAIGGSALQVILGVLLMLQLEARRFFQMNQDYLILELEQEHYHQMYLVQIT